MQSKLNPYLNFKNNAREVMEFYKTVFDADVTFSTFKDFHASVDASEDDKIMHSVLTAKNGIKFMAADTPNHMEYKPGNNISMALSGEAENEDELTGYYNKLMDGGVAPMPFATAPWGDKFGMVIDKYGIQWLVNIVGKKAE